MGVPVTETAGAVAEGIDPPLTHSAHGAASALAQAAAYGRASHVACTFLSAGSARSTAGANLPGLFGTKKHPAKPMLVDQVSDFDSADTDALVLMWRQSFEHALGITDPNPLERQRGYHETEIRPHTRVQVVKRHGKLVAFLAAHERYLAQLYVRVGCSGQGIGSMLLRLAQAQSGGSLSLHTLARNDRARRFYEHHGFKVVGSDYEPMWELESVEYRWCRPASVASRGSIAE